MSVTDAEAQAAMENRVEVFFYNAARVYRGFLTKKVAGKYRFSGTRVNRTEKINIYVDSGDISIATEVVAT